MFASFSVHLSSHTTVRHDGNADFNQKLTEFGGLWVGADRYVAEVGNTINLMVKSDINKDTFSAKANGMPLKTAITNGADNISVPVTQPGEIEVLISYAVGKTTKANLLGIRSEQNLIRQRTDFIINRQQTNNPDDPRFGAFMVFDIEGDSVPKSLFLIIARI